VVCIVLISQVEISRPQELVNSYENRILTRDGTIDLKLDEKPQHLLQYLKQDKDVARPVKRRMHPLSLAQIMQQNQQDVDDLRPVGPTAHMAVGPDGLRDEGSLSDLALLAGMSHQDTVDADRMNAIDGRHAVPTPQLFDVDNGQKDDMMVNADKIDTKAQLALAQSKARNMRFKVVSGVPIGGELDDRGVHDPFNKLDSLHASDVHKIKDRFHAMPITDKEAKASQTQAADDWTVPSQQTAQKSESDAAPLADLGEEGPAEAMTDPMPPPKADEGPGIWVEPGSNKGFDSYALDSLQPKDEA
jgi:hypothetical protein